MARAREVYDNAFMESFWWRLEAGLVHQRVFRLYRNSTGRPASSATRVPRL